MTHVAMKFTFKTYTQMIQPRKILINMLASTVMQNQCIFWQQTIVETTFVEALKKTAE